MEISRIGKGVEMMTNDSTKSRNENRFTYILVDLVYMIVDNGEVINGIVFSEYEVKYIVNLLNELNNENQQLKLENGEMIDYLARLEETNQQLKEQIKIYEEFLKGNDLDFDWSEFCTADECIIKVDEEFDCKDCKHMRWTE